MDNENVYYNILSLITILHYNIGTLLLESLKNIWVNSILLIIILLYVGKIIESFLLVETY